MIGAALCMNEMRKLKPGEWVEVFEQSLPKPPDAEDVVIHHVDRDLVVLEKPSGMVTLRHPAEINWSTERTKVQPVLEEVIPELIYRRQTSGNSPLLSVHRIDRGTSGLLVFARSAEIQQALIDQFASHDVVRVYQAVVQGNPESQTVRGQRFRDRGEGLRGSVTGNVATKEDGRKVTGQLAITHVKPLRNWQASRWPNVLGD